MPQPRRPPAPLRRLAAPAAALALAVLAGSGCATRSGLLRTVPPERRARPEKVVLETTGYCPCGACCNWRRQCLFWPVVASGPGRGQRKAVGVTASGTRARRGTLAADTRLFPYGTVMWIPGYGYGRVEDRGGAIVGRRIDLYFPSHAEALRWGRVRKEVSVWRP